jgi:hypothetical protein
MDVEAFAIEYGVSGEQNLPPSVIAERRVEG